MEEISKIGLAPLSDDAPDPLFVRDESEEFMLLETEIDKLGALHATDPINWRNVVETAALIIREKSKDIKAATYLCRGLFEQEGYAGLAVGFKVLLDVLTEHWDTAFPPVKRAKRRAGEVEWLVERVGKRLPDQAPKAEDQEAAILCADRADEITAFLSEKLDNFAPNLRELYEPLRDFRRNFAYEAEQKNKAEQKTKQDAAQKAQEEENACKAEAAAKKAAEEKAAQDQEAAPAAAAVPKAAPPVASSAPVPQTNVQQPPTAPPPKIDAAPATAVSSQASEQEIKKAFQSSRTTLNQIAAYKRGLDLSNPVPYGLVRFAAWMAHEKPPNHQSGKCYFPGPPQSVVKGCTQLAQQGQHAQLIEQVESTFAKIDAPGNIYWLDAHRLTSAALEALGPPFAAARQAVVSALAEFIRRMPGIADLQFNDGAALADAQTKIWIQDEVLAEAAGTPAASGGTSDANADKGACLDAVKEARKLAGKNQFAEGLRLLQEKKQQAAGLRQRFFWDLEQARFCYEAGHMDIAIPQLEFLDTRAEHFHLDEWEPALSAEVAQLLLMCRNKKGVDKDEEADKRLYARLCRLDAAAALALNKEV
ncbi:MAG: type VI secretion system protein TssA [Gammaproteobacteria bacterium]|nr:type VI secretion system protein TssA [Gammaproteobacteria bacterium]